MAVRAAMLYFREDGGTMCYLRTPGSSAWWMRYGAHESFDVMALRGRIAFHYTAC